MKYEDRFNERQTLGLHKYENSSRGRLLSNERIEEMQNEDGSINTQYVYDVEDVMCYADDVYIDEVQRRIREKYSVEDELAIQRQRNVKKDEFNAYYDFCENVKKEVREEFYEYTK